MKLKVQLFGIFKERIGTEQIEVESSGPISTAALKAKLETEHAIIKEVKHYMLAVNQTYSGDDNLALNENDEIALIPPVAGG